MVAEQCAVCREAASQRCCSCMLTYYCGRDHQKLDWQKHKKICRPFKICTSAALGRHLVATRDIKPGETVLKEAPLVSGPPLITSPVCLGCYQLLDEKDHVVCPTGCGWPMCSEKCAGSDAHRPECDITRNVRGDKMTIRNFMMTHPTYQCVTALRCLWSRASNPGMWAKLYELESHCEKRKQTEKYETERVSVAQFIRKFFKLESVFTEDDILRICGVIQVNGHEVPISDPGHVAVYDVTSLLEHNCVPNCSKSFTSRSEVIIRAARAILRDEHLSISYTDTLWGTANRRHHLAETKYFWCQCPRCTDPSELGTYFSAIKCTQRDCTGYLLPINPLYEDNSESEKEVSTWQCGRCDVTVPGLQVADVVENIGQRLAEMEKGQIQTCEKFLCDLSGKVLHPNHFYLTDVRLALAQLIGQQGSSGLPGLEEGALMKKMTLCRQVLELAATLFPADVRVRGMLTFELHAVIAEEGRRKANSGEIEPGELKARLMESKRLLEESIFLLKNEPSVLPEGKILCQAKRNLGELHTLLQSIHATMGGDSPL